MTPKVWALLGLIYLISCSNRKIQIDKSTHYHEKKVIKTNIDVFSNELELPEEDQKLMQKAKKALKDSYSPYSNFKVGAAVLLANGKTVVGANQENAAYSICLCAERTALSNASSRFPKFAVVAIAVTAKAKDKITKEPVSPCGACRQYIVEVENRHKHPIKIIMQGEQGPVYVTSTAKSLLPLSFDGSLL